MTCDCNGTETENDMDAVDTVQDENGRNYHVYRCPLCGHEETDEETEKKEELENDGGLVSDSPSQ